MPVEFMRQCEIFRRKAIADLKAAEILFNADDVELDLTVALFHLQQAAEKLLKALLSNAGIHFEKLHDLRQLITLCKTNSISLPDYVNEFIELNPYAVEGRYAILHDDIADSGRFIQMMKEFERYVTLALP